MRRAERVDCVEELAGTHFEVLKDLRKVPAERSRTHPHSDGPSHRRLCDRTARQAVGYRRCDSVRMGTVFCAKLYSMVGSCRVDLMGNTVGTVGRCALLGTALPPRCAETVHCLLATSHERNRFNLPCVLYAVRCTRTLHAVHVAATLAWELSIELLDERNALFARDLAVSNLLKPHSLLQSTHPWAQIVQLSKVWHSVAFGSRAPLYFVFALPARPTTALNIGDERESSSTQE
jgi:hypothetical protein